MSSGIHIENGEKKSGVALPHNGSGLNKLRPSKKITKTAYDPNKEKIQYMFKFVVRAYPEDFADIKDSLEEFMSYWD